MTRPFLLPLSFMTSRVGAITVAACTMALSLVFFSEARAATLTVTNCNDNGAGSLRARVAAAASGDTIDLRGLSCQRLYLTSGPIAVAQNTLTLRGPGFRRFVISGRYVDSAIRHSGTGTLRLLGMAIEKGNRQAQRALGGCVYSAGSVRAYDVEIRHCGAHGLGASPTFGAGGAVYAEGDVTISYSGIIQNTARGKGSVGGGIYAGRMLSLRRVLVWGSDAHSGGGAYAVAGLHLDTVTLTRNLAGSHGGAIRTIGGPVTIVDSTIYANQSNGTAGGLELEGLDDKLIINSTISGNQTFDYTSAGMTAGSAGVAAGQVTITNSTIAFNVARVCNAALAGMALHLESSIVADNTCGEGMADQDLMDYDNPQPITGGDNLVMSANVPLPADTISADPMLLSIADNGGRTQTHALAAGSPAVDRGNNIAGLAYDQRGVGFPRVNGASADIGAYER